jgi:hypothetical protein
MGRAAGKRESEGLTAARAEWGMPAATPLPHPAIPRAAAPSQADEAPPTGDLVTLTRVFNSLEAETLRSCLQAQGIPVTLGDLQTLQAYGLWAFALGGIRVMVPETFVVAARATLAAIERGDLAIDELPADAEPAPPEADTSAAVQLPAALWVALAVVTALIVF